MRTRSHVVPAVNSQGAGGFLRRVKLLIGQEEVSETVTCHELNYKSKFNGGNQLYYVVEPAGLETSLTKSAYQ